MLLLSQRHFIFTGDGVVYKHRSGAQWVLPANFQNHIPYNHRHLPVVIKPLTNEDFYLRWSIRRILMGFRAWTPLMPARYIWPE